MQPTRTARSRVGRGLSVAFRLEAVELERVTGRYGKLALVDGPRDRLGPYPEASARRAPDASECLSAEDILDFCGGRLAAPRAGLVQAHLDVCASCMDLVTLAINDWEPHEPTEWLEVASNFRPGDSVDGRYRILRFLASGGMGEVYEALDTVTSERVALKAVLAAACDNQRMLRHFVREARLGRRIRHRNVCHVFEARAADAARAPPSHAGVPYSTPYFTMQYVDGETLTERVRRAPLSIDAALTIARQLLDGLAAVHDAGVLHLDIKGSNVMLPHAEPLRPIILDFGLARRSSVGAPAQRVRPLTGSLAYMPPEQILGRAPNVQNDVFAFGVVLFQMLTRELPFPAAQRTTASSIVQRLSAQAPLPSSIEPHVVDWLDELVLNCLAGPERRYPNVNALQEIL